MAVCAMTSTRRVRADERPPMARRLPLVRSEAIAGPANRSTGTATATIMIAAADSDRRDRHAPVDVDRVSGERIRRIEREERRHQQRGTAQSRGRTDHGHDHRLHHFGRGDFRARCSQRGAHGEIAAAEHHVGQREVGEIGDGQECETNDGGQQHQHGVTLRAIARFPKVEHAVAPIPFEDRRPLVLDRRKQRRHFAFGLRRRDAGAKDARQPCTNVVPTRSTARRFSGVQNSVRVKAGSKPARITPMMVCESPSTTSVRPMTARSPPKRRCQKPSLNTATFTSSADFLLGEDAAGAGVAAERREEAGGDAAGRDAVGLAIAGDRAIGHPDALESFEAPRPARESA